MLRVERVSKEYSRSWTRQSLIKSVRNLSFRPQKKLVFTDLSLSVQSGEALGIAGANGSGKSTLLRMIADVISVTSGSISRPKRIVPVLSSASYLHGLFDIRENISIAATFYGVTAPSQESTVTAIAEKAGLTDRLSDLATTLSKGMAARLALASAFSADADLYLIDEIFDPLDDSYREHFISLLQEKTLRGASVIMTSHNNSLLEKACSRIITL